MSWLTRFKDDHKAVLFLLDKLEGLLKDTEYLGLRPTMFAEFNEFVEVVDDDIHPHFKAEEETVYPMAASVGEEARRFIDGMLDEHRKLYKVFDGFKQAVERKDAEEIRKYGFEIVKWLRVHIKKEETEVRWLVEQAEANQR
ncbi:hemerythrin domain-containing protein [Desulforudis sp. DRI-14]|uniref:hemerythrin domain-containing protein n=1 Tax=Desulforudis sp. DRI-14 TaxID=3459793 RepID=UPI004041BB9D